MGVLATIFGTTYVALSGPSKAPAATPPINASSSDEAEFIKYDPSEIHLWSWNMELTVIRKFLEQAEADDKKTKH
jgi:F-type H+-transporting ATPase subunit k